MQAGRHAHHVLFRHSLESRAGQTRRGRDSEAAQRGAGEGRPGGGTHLPRRQVPGLSFGATVLTPTRVSLKPKAVWALGRFSRWTGTQ